MKIDSDAEINFHALMTRITGLQGFFSNSATHKLIKLIQEFNTDVVILLNLHGYYLNEKKLFGFLKQKKIKTLYIMPDEYPYLGKCCYSNDCDKYKSECSNCEYVNDYPKSLFFDQSKKIFKIKEESYLDFHNLTFISPEYNILKAKESTLLKDKNLRKVDWGIDIENTYVLKDRFALKKKYGLPLDKKIVLLVGSFLSNRKAINRFYYECVLDEKLNNLFFINIGYDGDLDEIPKNFLTIGYVENQEKLAEYYNCADVYLLPSASDTMPLSCLISLSCGTPICCFKASGLPYIADDICGYYVNSDSMKNFIETLNEIPKKDEEIIKYCRKYAEARYDLNKFNNNILNIALDKGDLS
ncbi:MAG: glycosyltransferase [Erysipelotrichaceae bacterium]